MKTLIQVILYLAFVFILASFASCSSSEPTPAPITAVYTWRAKVLENNTITRVNMQYDERQSYNPHDSVWVNLDTHQVDDTAENTMLCELIQCRIN